MNHIHCLKLTTFRKNRKFDTGEKQNDKTKNHYIYLCGWKSAEKPGYFRTLEEKPHQPRLEFQPKIYSFFRFHFLRKVTFPIKKIIRINLSINDINQNIRQASLAQNKNPCFHQVPSSGGWTVDY